MKMLDCIFSTYILRLGMLSTVGIRKNNQCFSVTAYFFYFLSIDKSPQEELESVAGEKGAWNTLLPLQHDFGENGWMDSGWMDKSHFCKKYRTGIGIFDSTCGIRSDRKICRICTSLLCEIFRSLNNLASAPRWKPDEKQQNGSVNW